MKRWAVFALAFIFAVLSGMAWAWYKEWLYPYAALLLPLDRTPSSTIAELALEETIPLGNAAGRIDHLAIDLRRGRLLIAEFGNNSVGIVDLRGHVLSVQIPGFDEPQGIAYVPASDTIFIANGRNGIVDAIRGEDLSPLKKISLGSDADNIRSDGENQIIAGYGSGGLAVIDAKTVERRGDIPLTAHPESFQLDPNSDFIFVNEPTALKIGVVNRRSGKEVAGWGATGAAANFPMAIDRPGHRLFVAYRLPALITAFSTENGALLDREATCGDADDVFHDEKRNRIYVICGDGSIAVIDASGTKLKELSRLRTRPGARTGLYVPELDRLFVALPKRRNEPAAVWAFAPK